MDEALLGTQDLNEFIRDKLKDESKSHDSNFSGFSLKKAQNGQSKFNFSQNLLDFL